MTYNGGSEGKNISMEMERIKRRKNKRKKVTHKTYRKNRRRIEKLWKGKDGNEERKWS